MMSQKTQKITISDLSREEHSVIKVTGGGGGGPTLRFLLRAVQHWLKMLPRADIKSHFWHPRVDTAPQFDSPRADK